MRRTQLVAVSALLLGLASCTSNPQATPVSPGPLQGSTSVKPSVTPTTQKPVVTPAPATKPGTTPACADQRRWNADPKSHITATATVAVTKVETGSHDCFDQISITLNGRLSPRYRVSYVRQAFTQGKGDPLCKSKALSLMEIVIGANSLLLNQPGTLEGDPAIRGWQSIDQTCYGGSFEATTSFAAVTRGSHTLPFDVSTWSPTKTTTVLIIKIAHPQL